jgi:lipoprotein signal peptidase
MNPPAIAAERATIHQPADTGQSLHGAWLLIARVAWVTVTLVILGLNIAMLPRFVMLLQTPCQPAPHCFYLRLSPFDQHFVQQYGLSLGFLAGYQAALYTIVVVVYCAIAAVIFWRRSADRMALLCAFVLVLFGGGA